MTSAARQALRRLPMRLGRPSSRRRVLRGAASLAIAALSGAQARDRGNAAPLALGVLLPRSGYLTSAGDSCLRGVKLAQHLARQLALPSFKIVQGDTGETLESAIAAAEQLIERGVAMLIGCYDSGQTVEVAKIAERHRVPLIINIAAAPSITAQGYRYVFRNFPDANRIVADSYSLQKQLFARTGYAPRRAVVLHINNGRGIEAIQSMFPQMDMPYDMAPPIAYDPKITDFSRIVATARATGADLLWTVSRMDDAIAITRELVRQDWTPAALMSSNAGLHEPQYVRALGPNANGALTFAPFYDPNKPLTRKLLAAQAQLYPDMPLGTLETYSFEAVLIALDAYSRAHSTDPQQLAAALRSTDLRNNVSPGPGITFDERGQNSMLGLIAIQTLAGVGHVVLPAAAADATPLCPIQEWRNRVR